jgi:hypothetical protein
MYSLQRLCINGMNSQTSSGTLCPDRLEKKEAARFFVHGVPSGSFIEAEAADPAEPASEEESVFR